MESRGWLVSLLHWPTPFTLRVFLKKGAKKIKTTKRSIISSMSSTELTKLKSLTKFRNQPVVQLSWNLGPKLPQPQPELEADEIMKFSKVSKCNGCRALFCKTDKKLYILGGKAN